MDISPSYQGSSNAENPKTVITKKDRRYQLAKLFIIAIVSIVTVALTIIDVIQTAKSFANKRELNYKIQGSIVTALVIHNLQKERGMTVIQLGCKQLHFQDERLTLRDIRRKTNESIIVLEKREDAKLSSFTGGRSLSHILKNLRSEIDEGRINIVQTLQTYQKWIAKLISRLTKYTESENLEDYANLVYSYEMVVLSKEEAGMERALGGLKFTHGKNFTLIDTTWYNEKRVLAENYLETAYLFSSALKDLHTSAFTNTSHLMERIKEKREVLSGEIYNKWSVDEAYEWFALMTKYSNLMLALQKRLADMIERKVNEQIHQSTNQLAIRSMLLCFTLIIVPCIIISLAKVQKSFYKYTLSLFDKVGLEQSRTDFLMRENARHCDSKYRIVSILCKGRKKQLHKVAHIVSQDACLSPHRSSSIPAI